MSKFEIIDPQLRQALVSKTGHVRLIHEHQYETAYEIFNYISDHLDERRTCDQSLRPFLVHIESFFDYSGTEYDAKSSTYLDGLVLHMATILDAEDLNRPQKARLFIACGNLFEMNRILIDIANQLHREHVNNSPER